MVYAGYTDCIPYRHTRLQDGTSVSSIGVCACVVSFLKISLRKVICSMFLLLEVCITCCSSQMLITLINMFKKIYTALGLYNHTAVFWPLDMRGTSGSVISILS